MGRGAYEKSKAQRIKAPPTTPWIERWSSDTFEDDYVNEVQLVRIVLTGPVSEVQLVIRLCAHSALQPPG